MINNKVEAFLGSSALLWSVLWLSFVSDDPSKDKKIPREELEYIIGATREIKKTKVDMMKYENMVLSH